MKKIVLTCFLFLSAALSINSYAQQQNEQSLDQIVAVVNDDVVTKSELNHALTTVKMQIAQQHLPVPSEEVLQKQVMDQLINRKLQLQMAKQAGITVNDADLNQAIDRIAKQNNVSVDSLYQHINQEGMKKEEYRDEIRAQMTMQKLQQQEVVSKISITPEEVNTFMRSKVWQTNESKEYHLEDILIPLSDTPSTEEIEKARTRAQSVIAKLNQGKSFREIAQAESGDAHALQGGDLGWRKLPEIPSAFAEQVAHMQAKEVAGPIQTPNGFHIIRVASVRATSTAQAQPDRKQIEDLLLQRKFEEAVQNWVSKIRSEAFIDLNPAKA